MPDPIRKYNLDSTGNNPDNLVSNESHILDNRPNRVVIPHNGPFFKDSLIVLDSNNSRILTKDIEYSCVQLCKEPTLVFGLPIYSVVLITTTNVSSNVTINYQCLGGQYQIDMTNLLDSYINAVNSNTPIDWINVLNKPEQYPPTIHNHLLMDVYGWENIVYGLERLTNAVRLSNVPEYEALIQYINQKIGEGTATVTNTEIDLGLTNSKLITFDKFLYALTKFNYNSIFMSLSTYLLRFSGNVVVNLSVSNVPDNTTYYWSIYHINTATRDFSTSAGIIRIVNGVASFTVTVLSNDTLIGDKTFRIKITKNGVEGFQLALSGVITIVEPSSIAVTRYYQTIHSLNMPSMLSYKMDRVAPIEWLVSNQAALTEF